MLKKNFVSTHNWNDPRSMLNMDLSNVERDQISQGANVSLSFVLKKRFSPWDIWSLLTLDISMAKMDLSWLHKKIMINNVS